MLAPKTFARQGFPPVVGVARPFHTAGPLLSGRDGVGDACRRVVRDGCGTGSGQSVGLFASLLRRLTLQPDPPFLPPTPLGGKGWMMSRSQKQLMGYTRSQVILVPSEKRRYVGVAFWARQGGGVAGGGDLVSSLQTAPELWRAVHAN